MTVVERKALELERKLDSLTSELQRWREESEESKPFEKHHSQIRRISSQLTGLQEALRAKLQGYAQAGTLLSACPQLEEDILDLHCVWDFFRSKLALRAVPFFKKYLAAADELAWKCYKPARSRAHAVGGQARPIKEPPLVFFDANSSPFARFRLSAYESVGENRQRSTDTTGLPPLIQVLPIPLIGTPWFQAHHLSDALILSHEVGHIVEDDFRLTSTLQGLLGKAGVPDERLPAWAAWLREVFADVYGCLALGPAFVSALMDFLAAEPQHITHQRLDALRWGPYPTRFLRVLLNLQVVDAMGFKQEADKYRKGWRALYPQHAMDSGFEEDIPKVVGALLKGPYPEFGGVSLREVLCFSAEEQVAASQDASRLLTPENPRSSNVRVLLAAARLAYEQNPKAYAKNDAQLVVLTRIEQALETGVRNSPQGQGTQEAKALEKADREAGAQLLGFLSSKGAYDPGPAEGSK